MRNRVDRYFLRGCYADNFTTNAGSGGDTFAADDIGGVKFSRIKLIVGADGTNDGDVASGNPLPITATALTTLATAVKAEDSASAGGDGGVVVMGMRQDTPAATSGTDGDYEPLRIKGGILLVDASLTTLTVASHAVTNAGTFAAQVTSIVPGVAATNLGKAEDAAHASGDVGVMALSVRQDTAAALAGTDADYQPLITDATGRLHVNAGTVTVASHAVTNAGTFAVQATIAAGAAAIAKAEDVASVDADVGVPAMAVRKATPANTSGADGDYEFLQMSVGRLWTAATATFGGTRSYKSVSGTLTADTDVVAAVSSKRIKVYALSLTTVGTSANAAIWKSNGTSGTELWRTILQGASGAPMGERIAVAPGLDGAFLFATVAGEKLTLDVGNGDALHYSLSYWDDDAT